jgi:protein PhnA
MSVLNDLIARSENKCELCESTQSLSLYPVGPTSKSNINDSIYICATCKTELEEATSLNTDHWQCLTSSMWNATAAVQVIVWRLLNALKNESWAQDALDQMYLEDETLIWAKAQSFDKGTAAPAFKHIDSNGTELENGDTVVLIKDLDVKGANFTAKRGTTVKNIILDPDNSEYIDGKVNGQKIVILTKYVKKS